MSYAEIVDEKKLAKIMRRAHAKTEKVRRETIKEINALRKLLIAPR